MKKIALVLTLVFACGLFAASAQTPAPADKQPDASGVKTETVKSDDGAKAKSCCASSMKSCKAGSMKCCVKPGASKSCSKVSDKEEAVVNEQKGEVPKPDNSK